MSKPKHTKRTFMTWLIGHIASTHTATLEQAMDQHEQICSSAAEIIRFLEQNDMIQYDTDNTSK